MGVPKGCKTGWPRLGSSLERIWLALGGPISVLFGVNGVTPCRTSISSVKARFSATAGRHFSRDLIRHLLIGGCGQSTYLLNWGTFNSSRE